MNIIRCLKQSAKLNRWRKAFVGMLPVEVTELLK